MKSNQDYQQPNSLSQNSVENNIPIDSKAVYSPSILEEAKAIIYGDREETYGHPDANMTIIANLWGAYLSSPVTVNDVCVMMILLKSARLKNSPEHRDSLVDLAGYAALMERVQDYRKEKLGTNRNKPHSNS